MNLGDKVKDKVTGFAGAVTARTEYLYGGTRAMVESLSHDGKRVQIEWFDEGRLELASSS